MPLDLSAALRRHLLQRFPADRDYPRAALHADGMPPLIAAFLDRTLDRWVEIERTQLRSDWFDFGRPEVQQAEAQFFDALARTARVPAEAWKGTLGGTVDLVVRYLTTPARALTDAIFEGSADPLPAAEVRARLPMFDAYPYFAEVAGAYLERKQTDTLEPPDLFGLLDRIDRRVVSEYGPDDWVALLAPLFEIARFVPEFDGVPAFLLKRFFEMKGEPDLAARVGKHVGSTLDEAALRALLILEAPRTSELTSSESTTAPISTNGGHTPAPPVPAADPFPNPDPPATPDNAHLEDVEPPEPEAADEGALADDDIPGLDDELNAEPAERLASDDQPLDDAEPDVPPAPPRPQAIEAESEEETEEQPADGDEHDSEAVPLWQRFAHRAEDDNVNARFGDGADVPTTGDKVHIPEHGAAPLWKRFFAQPDDKPSPLPPASEPLQSDPSERPLPARANSLEELEGRVLGASTSGQRSRFVKHLFSGDAGKYATVLHTLDGVDSWTEASQVIARDVFRPFRVNIYSDHAVAFTDAVEARFRK